MRAWMWATIGLGAVCATAVAPANAMCIENRSDRNIAVVRSAPFNDMTEYYQTMISPRGFECATMPFREGGVTPVSVYVMQGGHRLLLRKPRR
jgi:hypothetical protein